MIKRLLGYGADARSLTGKGDSLISLAVRQSGPGAAAAAAALIEAGADVNAVDSHGQTPLMAAAQAGNPEAVSALIRAGADVRRKDQRGKTALVLAADFRARPEVIQALLRADGGLQAVDDLEKSGLPDSIQASVIDAAWNVYADEARAVDDAALAALAAFATHEKLEASERLRAELAFEEGFKRISGTVPPRALAKRLLAAQAQGADRSLVEAASRSGAYKAGSPDWQKFRAEAIRSGLFSEQQAALAELVQRVGIETDTPLPPQGGGVERAILALQLKLCPLPTDQKSLAAFCLYQTALSASLQIMGCYSPEHINQLLKDPKIRQSSLAAYRKVTQGQ